MKIIPVDCNYVEAQFASAYLLIEGNRAFFIECNTNYAIPHLKKAVLGAGLTPEDVDGLCITHVHLDHAGGAGLFLKEFPNAKLYAHPRAARHAIDPSRLVASATQVYGVDFMKKLYGDILPCPADRVISLEDGQAIAWPASGSNTMQTKHTRGHANHHLCIFEPQTRTLFSGDSFGVSYPRINLKRGVIAVVSTSPTDFDGQAAIETVDWIESMKPAQVAPTHFGFMAGSDVPKAAKQLRDQIQFSIEMVKRIKRDQLSESAVNEHIHDWMVQYYANQGIHLDAQDLSLLSLDFKVNAQGLIFSALQGR